MCFENFGTNVIVMKLLVLFLDHSDFKCFFFAKVWQWEKIPRVICVTRMKKKFDIFSEFTYSLFIRSPFLIHLPTLAHTDTEHKDIDHNTSFLIDFLFAACFSMFTLSLQKWVIDKRKKFDVGFDIYNVWQATPWVSTRKKTYSRVQ